jgi:hypothetical protein
MSGVSGSDGVHGKTTRLVGGGGKGGHLVGLDGGAHLENIALKEWYESRYDWRHKQQERCRNGKRSTLKSSDE